MPCLSLSPEATFQSVLSRFSQWFIVAALVLSIGGHWAFLQTIAWVGMTVTYSQSDSLAKALVKTFDGKHPCKICKLVTEGKNSEKKHDKKLDLKKLDLSILAEPARFFFSTFDQSKTSFAVIVLPRAEAPSSPPPNPA